MNKTEYIQLLQEKLSSLPKEEIENAIEYVSEYYDECQDENQAYHELGDPQKFAAQIKAEFAIKQNDLDNTPDNPLHSQYNLKNILIIILGIFSLPISVPLILVAIALVAVFAILLAIPFLILVILCAAFLFSIAISVKVIFTASSLMFTDILVIISAILVFISLLCLCLAGLMAFGGRFIPWIMHMLGQLFHHLKGDR